MWRNAITLCPDALQRTYRAPLEHFTRVPYHRDTVPGTSQSALVPPIPIATPVHNVSATDQPSGAAPVHNVLPGQSATW